MGQRDELFTLDVNLGGTKVKTALMDINGRILSVHMYPTHAKKGTGWSHRRHPSLY
ncbi:MAG: hypothetical protein NWF13_01520 [Candidatus Bathyarchaeota archaeon]|nr:hypothetical protein [Candidatus Bathyarchaeota archaeon]